MALEKLAATTQEKVTATLSMFGRDYNLQFGTVDRLCTDVILGLLFLQRHSEVSVVMGGTEAPLQISAGSSCYVNVVAAKSSHLHSLNS